LTYEAANSGVQAIVFPELFLTHHVTPDKASDTRNDVRAGSDGLVRGPLVDAVAAASQFTGVKVLIGAAVKWPQGARTNSLLVADGSGAMKVAYNKQFLNKDGEAELFVPGSTSAIVDMWGWKVALGLGHDVAFPEHARTAATSGAHAYLCPSAIGANRAAHTRVLHAARAVENTMFGLFVNQIGKSFATSAGLYGPDAEAIDFHYPVSTRFQHVDLSPAHLAIARSEFPVLAELATGDSGYSTNAQPALVRAA
jgi:predicted amidohydrolase